MRLAIMGAGVLVLAGCATKSYPTIPMLSEYEKQNMTCADLAEELRGLGEYQRQITSESNPDIDTLTGVLLDFGIRNAMALDDANEGLRNRRKDILNTYHAKGC